MSGHPPKSGAGGLISGYAAPLIAIGAIASFIGVSIVVGMFSGGLGIFAGLTSAAQANDAIGMIQDLVQLQADLKTPVTFDQAAFRAWYSKKIDPIEIEFRKNAHQVPRYVVTRTQLV